MKRFFSKKERIACALVQDVPLEGMHADHIQPFSKGGETVVENCQLIPAHVNLAKGNRVVDELREWQKRFVDAWGRRERGEPFLLTAVPSTGKTVAALTVLRRWRQAHPDGKVAIVVPTVALQEQWQTEAEKIGIHLQTKEFATDFSRGFSGFATTYAAVGQRSLIYRKICASYPVFVVFDEVHHCGDQASWGDAIKYEFELAKELLLLSGTPWRTDGRRIPWVKYDDRGVSIAHERYDYLQAIRDRVIRLLAFHHHGGEIVSLVTGTKEEVYKDITDDEAARRLKRLLNPHGQYVKDQIRDAHERLLMIRRTTPDAGALAICIDQDHATIIAKVIRDVTRCEPSVIVSDEERSNDTKKDFKNSKREWAVAVRQINEGADIPRLQVLCYMTNWVTEQFFYQAIGRVTRIREDGVQDEAHVFMPADPRLIKMSTEILSMQEQVRLINDDNGQPPKPRGPRNPNNDPVDPYTTATTGRDVFVFGDSEFEACHAQLIMGAAEAEGITCDLAARLFMRFNQANKEPPIAIEGDAAVGLEKRLDDLRKECNTLANALANRLVSNRSEIKQKTMEIHLRFKKQGRMSVDELLAKKARIAEWIEKGDYSSGL